MKTPHAGFIGVWLFWWLGGIVYTYGLATGTSWTSPVGGLTWLMAFGLFEVVPPIIERPQWMLSGVVGWLIRRLSAGGDRSWEWLADAIALPIAVLIVFTFVVLFGGWVGWAFGLGLGGILLLILHKHFRFVAL